VEWLNSLLSRIVEGTLLPAGDSGRLDCDAALTGVLRPLDGFEAATRIPPEQADAATEVRHE